MCIVCLNRGFSNNRLENENTPVVAVVVVAGCKQLTASLYCGKHVT
jgi:hypothetical protein